MPEIIRQNLRSQFAARQFFLNPFEDSLIFTVSNSIKQILPLTCREFLNNIQIQS